MDELRASVCTCCLCSAPYTRDDSDHGALEDGAVLREGRLIVQVILVLEMNPVRSRRSVLIIHNHSQMLELVIDRVCSVSISVRSID